ncbi:MAG TPA: SAM-dependent methyltransferase, partial [Polyangiaceae bacterium]|nr:SAM-dependent methyltransferase [Polyangiaceae bacterium]
MARGSVSLVGAGPGDPGLLSVRGADLLGRAAAIVYERGVHPALLELAAPDAQRLAVDAPGEGLAAALEAARQGLAVAWLRRGDPWLAGGAELEALARAGLSFEVAPAVAPELAAAAYAGIALGRPGRLVVWGEAARDAPPPGSDATFVAAGPLALRSLASALLAAGHPPTTPAALVEHATTPAQRTALTSIGELAAAAAPAAPPDASAAEGLAPSAAAAAPGAPAEGLAPSAAAAPPGAPAEGLAPIAFVGPGVAAREALRWFDRRPLFGKRVAITRAAHQAREFVRALRERGAEALSVPTIAIHPPPDPEPLRRAVAALGA